ncbi:hypothetical protein IV203_018719 [Nitzschia inconspicua]|uniref:Uncharacterized protein n=1 Tax=Nitzschia inconspicua TaxID=303405 RepID=A0A9K3M407_9STRA|nr:hypothetical protein IV203_018719 [Nitzschia inconspicua]
MIASSTPPHAQLICKDNMVSLAREPSLGTKKSMRTKYKIPKRRLHFASNSSHFPICDNATAEDLQSRWYSAIELTTFKEDAVQFADQLGPHAPPRGLEGYTKERLKHKINTVRCIVVAYRKGKDSEFVAELSRKCSGWNKELAFNQACRDYFEVYDPSMLSQVQPVLTKAPKISLVRKIKSVMSETAAPASAVVPTVSPGIVENQKIHIQRILLRRQLEREGNQDRHVR